MKMIIINFCQCGMSDKYFSKKIRIYKPTHTKRKTIFINKKNEHKTIFEILQEIKYIQSNQTNIEEKNIYVKKRDYLLKGIKHKTIKEISNYIDKKILRLYIFDAVGASEKYRGFLFIVHSKEKIHEHQPHLHVQKNNVSVSYNLEKDNIRRKKGNKGNKEINNAEKKVIIPFINKNFDKFMELWNDYMNGYDVPIINDNNEQYYDET